MKDLIKVLGQELDVDAIARTLYTYAHGLQAPVVGAMQLTCSDESERETIDAFQQIFADYLLPDLKFGERSHFRCANLGGRYEWGAVHIAEDHYATEAVGDRFKLILVKLNSHVCVEQAGSGFRFGRMRRYDTESTYCGALHALLDGAQLPFADDLRRIFSSGGKDRLSLLLDDERVAPAARSLWVAVSNALLQAGRVLLDIQSRPPKSPTLFIVLPCVTLNKKTKDSEVICGIFRADRRSDEPVYEYQGLGDDPTAYRLQGGSGRVIIDDGQLGTRRRLEASQR